MNLPSPIAKKHARIEIIPLIDIMFFLLASFMMVSISQVTMKGMKVQLPVGSSGETQSKKDYVSFSVDRDGFVYFDKARIEYADVASKMRGVSPEAKVFIRGDSEALHGNVTRLLDQIRATGFTKIAFEIRSQSGAGVPAPGK
ncbi:MAG: biopolymer transporter ExbD [Verrucomicrobiota bacterium]|nr:biopolymer transporter ExbD [Verrucomicrobiota bacterium]